MEFDTLLDMLEYYKKNMSVGETQVVTNIIHGESLPFSIYRISDDFVVSDYDTGAALFTNNGVDGSIQVIIGEKLTIETGIFFSPPNRCKGFCLYVSKLLNKGIISMTQRGCVAVGQDIYLIKNSDDSYEYVPAVGASGGAWRYISTRNAIVNGNWGGYGQGRQTGGGGTGAGRNWLKTITIGAGGSGTSFSGGSGSGAANSDGSYGGNAVSANAPNNGGAGSAGAVNSSNSSGYGQISLGGCGNGVGTWRNYRITPTNYKVVAGTGGLLIIFAISLNNNSGIIQSDGAQGASCGASGTNGRVDAGGASGGGSINIFTANINVGGSLHANGGVGFQGLGGTVGGYGGNGTVTITPFKSRYFVVKDNNFIKSFKEDWDLV